MSDAKLRPVVLLMSAVQIAAMGPNGVALDESVVRELAELTEAARGLVVMLDVPRVVAPAAPLHLEGLAVDLARGSAAHAAALLVSDVLAPWVGNVLVASDFQTRDDGSVPYSHGAISRLLEHRAVVVAVPTVGDRSFECGLAAGHLAHAVGADLVLVAEGGARVKHEAYRSWSRVVDAELSRRASSLGVSTVAVAEAKRNRLKTLIAQSGELLRAYQEFESASVDFMTVGA
jgi:hypothetical protein